MKVNDTGDVSVKGEMPAGKKQRRLWKYYSAVLWNIIFFFFINLYPLWISKTRGGVTNDYIKVLLAMDVSVITIIIGNAVLIAFSPKRLRELIEFFISVTSLISVSVFLGIFPLDFSHIAGSWLNTVIRCLLIAGIVGTSIGTISSLIKFIKAIMLTDSKVLLL